MTQALVRNTQERPSRLSFAGVMAFPAVIARGMVWWPPQRGWA